MEVPPVAEVFEHAMRLGPMLWTRRPEHWNFLVGAAGHLPRRVAQLDRGRGQPGRPARVHRAARPAARALPLRRRRADRRVVPGRRLDRRRRPEPARRRTRCAAWPCSSSACTPPTRSSPSPSATPTGRASSSGSSGCRTPRARRARSTDCRSPTPRPRPTRCSARSRSYVLGAPKQGRPSRGAPFAETWNPMRYGTDVERAGEGHGQRPSQTSRSCVVVTERRPGRPARDSSQVLERGADVGVHARVLSRRPSSRCPAVVPQLRRRHRRPRAPPPSGSVRNGDRLRARARRGRLRRVHAHVRQAARAGRRREHRRSTTPPTSPNSVVVPVAGRPGDRPRTRTSVIDRWRQNNTIIDRSRPARSRGSRRRATCAPSSARARPTR